MKKKYIEVIRIICLCSYLNQKPPKYKSLRLLIQSFCCCYCCCFGICHCFICYETCPLYSRESRVGGVSRQWLLQLCKFVRLRADLGEERWGSVACVLFQVVANCSRQTRLQSATSGFLASGLQVTMSKLDNFYSPT